MSTNKITRKEALKRIGGLALGSALLSSSVLQARETPKGPPPVIPPGKGDKPNILWITLEGVPLSVLSCYGSRLIQTPNIDRIAREGMQFRNAFTSNALCAPARATLLTGKYNHLNGMITNPGGTTSGQTSSLFDPTQPTCAQILRQHGYQTGTVGKWHLVSAPGQPSNPGLAGFDYFVFKEGAGGPYYSPKGYLRNPSLGSTAIEQKEYPGYITDNFTDFAIQGMKQFRQPFLMMVQYFSVHRPFDPPHQYEHLYDGVRIPEPGTFWDDYTGRASPAEEARMRIAFMPDFHAPESLTDRQRQQWNYQQFMAHFLGTLKAVDDNVGRLLHYLDESGLAKDTVVVITGDHGFFMGEHGWFDKRFMYEPAIRVPWLVRYPGVTKPSSTSDAMVVDIDNAPTILSLAGLEVPADMQGASLLPHIEGNPPAQWRDAYYYHYHEFAPPHWVPPHYGVRTDRYKLINYYPLNEWELFDLQNDPDEMDNLMEWSGYKVNPAYESVAQDLLAKLKQLREQYQDTTGMPVRFWPTRSYD